MEHTEFEEGDSSESRERIEESLDQRDDAIRRAKAILTEYFDCVQILASFTDPHSGTYLREDGSGNHFARIGMAQEYIGNDKAKGLARRIAEEMVGDE